jgi:hypothetical protein
VTIAVVGAVVISSLIGGVGTGLSQRNPPSYAPPAGSGGGQQTTGDYSPLAQGEPGSPVAVAPTECEGPCFDESSAEQAILPEDAFEGSGLPAARDVWAISGDRTTAAQLFLDAHQGWSSNGTSPDECFVTWSEYPVVEPEGATVADGFVAPLTEHESDAIGVTRLSQAVRLFPDSDSAEEYMQTLADGIDGCTRYINSSGYPVDVVTPEPGVHPPDTVAAVGFAQSPQAGIRYYVFDMQRGNMVIRSYAVSDGGLEDTFFRTLMSKQATALGEITPAD